jgi:hypothetical protein
MYEFFVRGLAMILTAIILVFLLPLLLQLFFSLGPVKFVIALLVFFLAGSLLTR